jgi:paraquat-inducible protein B
MTIEEKREAKHHDFSRRFGGFTSAEGSGMLATYRARVAEAEKRLDSHSIQIEELRAQKNEAEKCHDIESLHEWLKLTKSIYALESSASLIWEGKDIARQGVEGLEEAFQVEIEFRRWGFSSIFADPTPKKKAPTRARKRR